MYNDFAVATHRRIDDGHERRALMSELYAWGKWVETHSEYTGHPGVNFLVAALHGRGGGSLGHRILCLEMPTGVYATHQRVLRLPAPEQAAVQIKHVTVLNDDGTIQSVEERRRLVGISEEAFRKRLSRAYQRIMGIVPL